VSGWHVEGVARSEDRSHTLEKRSSTWCLNFDSDCVNLRTPLGQSQLKGRQQLAQFGGGGGAGHQQAPFLVLQGARQHMRAQARRYQVLHLVQAPTGFPDALLKRSERRRGAHSLLETEHGVVRSGSGRHGMKVVRFTPEDQER
jgi:hypothetical protein